LQAELEVTVYGMTDLVIARWTEPVDMPPHGAETRTLASRMDGFIDLTWAYRFGPQAVSLVHARLLGAGRRGLGDEAFYTPGGCGPSSASFARDPGLSAELVSPAHASPQLRLRSRGFAHTVHIASDTHAPDDNDFHLPPQGERLVALSPRQAGVGAVRAQVGALNTGTRLSVRSES
jgi:beta-mannosidase